MNVLGIDIGGSGIKGAPVDAETGALITDRHRIPTPQPATPSLVVDVVAQIVDHFSWKGRIGVAFPARIKHGIVQTASNIDEAWIGKHAGAMIQEKTGCFATVLNDADAAGMAEMAYGAGRGERDLVLMLTFGTGIGTALFYDGRLIPNMEFGHIELMGQDAEDYAANRVRKDLDLSWEAWATRAQKYLSHVEFLLAPDLIILGGGVSRPHRFSEYAHLLTTEARLVPAALENEAGIIGAASWAQQHAGD